MEIIKDKEFGGERPLFGSRDLMLDNVIIHAGESALKRCTDITAIHCRFEGKYPFWHVDRFEIEDCLFTPGARAAIWYSHYLQMKDCRVEAPKMFREMDGIRLENVEMTDADETLWHCSNVKIRGCRLAGADYLFMHSAEIDIDGYHQQGNYSFQYCRNVVIRNAEIDSKDAFWNTENVTLIDCSITGEYLGWHSKGLKLVRCKIAGTQPLCYCKDLVMEDCTMDADADLAFEESVVNATINGHITSVKNPTSGSIIADSIGEIILDGHAIAPANCKIDIRNER